MPSHELLTASRPALERRILAALDANPSRIPVVLGDFRTGRTQLLCRLRERLGRTHCQQIDLERAATTPERFYQAVTKASPFRVPARTEPASAREAFDAMLTFLDQARVGGGNEPATFFLDEVLELRTFESFPGLRTALRELLKTLSATQNRFVLTTRYVSRAHRLLRDATSRFEVIHVPPLSSMEVHDLMLSIDGGHAMLHGSGGSDSLARSVFTLSDGRVGYAQAIGEALSRMVDAQGVGDPVSALTQLLSPDGRLAAACASCYELRLHRARGYGALKAILEILAQEEPLTLTEVAQRLRRTPGSTKDYLSWLEDVDLIVSQRKRYSFSDPLLRVWVRLYCRPSCPSDEDVAREVQSYALARLPQPEPAMVIAGGGENDLADDDRKPWGIIEID
ncbi:MAG TPA: winged helix-turn-helix domain-containing protein [Vicinamibacterales bacterium]|nr:winged helix-turn-helix domain-containing protein [Vicinamibacterales bacterium]